MRELEPVLQSVAENDVVTRSGEWFAYHIQCAVKRLPDAFDMSEEQLVEDAAEAGTHISTLDRRIKLSFWNQYLRARDSRETVNIERVCEGIITKKNFERLWLQNAYRAAWLLLPPKGYQGTLEALLIRGLDRLEEILEMDIRRFSKNAPL